MMDFYNILEEVESIEGYAKNPYAGKRDGEWTNGFISIDWLNTHFGEFDNATDMIAKAESYGLEGIVLYFRWLVDEGKIEM